MNVANHPIFEHIPDLWHHIVQTMDEALFLVDTNQDIIYFNRRAEEITGYSSDEVLGRHCLAGFRCPKCAVHCGLFDSEHISDVEVEITRKDGSRVIALKNAVVLKDQQGNTIGGLETFRDITNLRDQMTQCSVARSQAENREKTLEAVLGSIREGIIALDPDHRIVSVSRRAREILGLKDEAQLLGQPCSAVLGSSLCEQNCPLKSPREPAELVIHQRSTLLIEGSPIHVTEGLSPLLDEQGQSLGHLIILTEISPEGLGNPGETFYGLIGQSKPMVAVFERIRQLSASEVTVLITGESGTGKELAAQAIHKTSPRASGPFLAVNCAALPEGLLESEIFGHVKGAFTGAIRDRKGRVELAHHGTLFLDEVGELPLALQSKLLRLVQERTFERLGEEKTRKADIRIIAATNRDLTAEVASGHFREDLFYRLKVVPLQMPPLRERGRDIAILAARMLDKQSQQNKRNQQTRRPSMFFTPEAITALLSYSWPGNVRELVNTIEYVVALTPQESVTPEDLPPEIIEKQGHIESKPADSPPVDPIRDIAPEDEEQLVRKALEKFDFHRVKTAEYLGVNRVTLYRLMKRYNIKGPRGKRRGKLDAEISRKG